MSTETILNIIEIKFYYIIAFSEISDLQIFPLYGRYYHNLYMTVLDVLDHMK